MNASDILMLWRLLPIQIVPPPLHLETTSQNCQKNARALLPTHGKLLKHYLISCYVSGREDPPLAKENVSTTSVG